MARARRVGSSRPQIQSLEGRTLLAVTPYHLTLAQRSVAEILPQDNLYSGSNTNVTWAGINGAAKTVNRSDCTTYITALLKTAYGYTNTQLRAWTGSPDSAFNLNEYFDGAKANLGFESFKQIAELDPGDLLICDYPDGASARGHFMIIEEAPRYSTLTTINVTDANGANPVPTTVRVYYATIIDVTGSVHSSDTRRSRPEADGSDDTGVGRGNITLLTSTSGELIGWRWGTGSGSSQYVPARYDTIFFSPPTRIDEIRFDPTKSLNVEVEFNNAMSLASIALNDLKVTNTSTGGTFVPTGVSLSANGKVATFTLPDNVTNGNYRFSMTGSTVSSAKGNIANNSLTLEGDSNFILRGDINRDRKVDFDDLLIISQNYGQSGKLYAQGNIDYSPDTLVDFSDLLILAQSYGKTLVTAAPELAAAKPSAAAKPRTSMASDLL